LYAVIKYVDNRRYTLGLRLFRQYLYQPYSYFLDHNTSELSKNILAEVNQVVNGVMRPVRRVFVKNVLVTRVWVQSLVAG
jgi:ATP-binding cassette, subfamily B, bacterial PglK